MNTVVIWKSDNIAKQDNAIRGVNDVDREMEFGFLDGREDGE